MFQIKVASVNNGETPFQIAIACEAVHCDW